MFLFVGTAGLPGLTSPTSVQAQQGTTGPPLVSPTQTSTSTPAPFFTPPQDSLSQPDTNICKFAGIYLL